MREHDKRQRTYDKVPIAQKGGGPGSAGQSGDTQGLPDIAEAGPESVQELVEEGQYFEAEVLLGVEAPDEPGIAEVQTHEARDKTSLWKKAPGRPADGSTNRGSL